MDKIGAWCEIGFTGNAKNPLYYGHNLYLGDALITDLIIPADVTSIGVSAFFGCSGLTAVHITDIAAWCGIAFSDSSANPLVYAHNLYLNGEMVTDLVIPDSVTSIGNYAFYNCSGLTSATIPNSVTSIGNSAFLGCSGLTSMTIPDGVTSIGDSAFSGCTGLTSITIPDSVTSIGGGAFYSCEAVQDVFYAGTATAWNGISIGSNNTNLTNARIHYNATDSATHIFLISFTEPTCTSDGSNTYTTV